ncbi:MAG: NAD-dependent epimerase/dehydratase family protein [Patescibacteria group bacterium]
MSLNLKNKRILVTGGAGFIGSFLVEKLVKIEAKVRVADNLSNGSLDNLKSVKNKIEFLKLDLRNYKNCLKATEGQDFVFNLAAKVTNIGYNREHHIEMFEENMLLQMYPIKAAFENKVKKFLQGSTVCVYPHDAIIPTPESEGEKGRPEDTNEGYGWAKRMGEVLAKFYHQKGMPVVVSRFSNAYGPRDHFDLKIAHVIPAFIVKCLKNKNVEVWGTGKQTRSFLYVEDAAEALLKIMRYAEDPYPINTGGSKMISMENLLKLIIKELKTNNQVVWDTSYSDGHKERQADTTRMKKITDWTPKTDLKVGLKKTIDWYLTSRAVKPGK